MFPTVELYLLNPSSASSSLYIQVSSPNVHTAQRLYYMQRTAVCLVQYEEKLHLWQRRKKKEDEAKLSS